MRISPDDFRSCFDKTTYERGVGYYHQRMVSKVKTEGGVIQAQVRGSGVNDYHQSIRLLRQGPRLAVEGDCSCPMEYNCKHVVAALLAACAAGVMADQGPPDQGLPYEMGRWLADLAYRAEQALALRRPPAPFKNEFRLIYVLMLQPGSKKLRIQLCKGRVAADGVIRSATPLKDTYAFQQSPPAYARAEELSTAAMYIGLLKSTWNAATVEPAGAGAAQLLELAGASGALYFGAGKDALRSGLVRLQKGPPRHGRLGWQADAEEDGLRLGWRFDDDNGIDYVLPTSPPAYVADGAIGPLTLPESLALLPLSGWLELVEGAPRLNSQHAAAFAEEMFDAGLEHILPVPHLPSTVLTDVRPTPVLILHSLGAGPAAGDFGLLAFQYKGRTVGANPALELVAISNAGIERIERHAEDEAAALAELLAQGFEQDRLHGELRQPSELAWLAFMEHGLPSLRARGWHIELTPGFRYDLATIDEWYAQVDDGGDAGHAWLELELGIVVNGAAVALLPVLLQLIRLAPQDFAPAALEARGDDEHLLAALPGGVQVALPWGRIKPILQTLGELYFTDRIGSALRMTQLDAARLAELEAGSQLRWVGGERLRALGRELSAFERVRAVAAPAGLQASLRPYQAEGLAWMQFLREYGLAGILADDMGLGKTIQTLSHILTEKEAGRLTTPALVVAPTSLMDNWQAEAARFAPGLRVLVLTGPDRQQRYGEIGAADLVLTSYALLPRDEELLRQQRFHLLILDESQYIKNHRSKAAQTAGLLSANHRLCLTGTPMQNHLGELWAQFNFLLPGLLGDERTFNATFRKPIEKQGDSARNAFLIRRIKPFLLRRTKDSVAKELPPKTEIVRMVDLNGAQRDLYETVRLAMDSKVRAEIARKGVARSQIVILDALLKLRQVCCDPRLLKASRGQKTDAPSAKLQVLMELMEELLAEDRKLLVFSQFTSMLSLIEAELRARGVSYALLTGDTDDRATQVQAFQGGQVPVFLISLKAGGVGLNLTAADTVIHYDPWWNPAAEDQATDRAWRIGQDKPVFVYRLIAKGTLEEKIQQLQRTKAVLADAVLAGGETQGLQIRPEDLLEVLSTSIS